MVRIVTTPSSLQYSAVIVVDSPVSTSAITFEPALDVPAISVTPSSTHEADWAQLVGSTHVNVRRPDA